jgi:hypothetical protein
MAQRKQSLLLYGFEVNASNASIDFQSVSGGIIRQATLPYGFFTLDQLLANIAAQMMAADPGRVYAASATRTFSGGTQNRVTIQTTGAYLSLLFASGPRNSTAIDGLIGFLHADYVGAITYTGPSSAGVALVPEYPAYSYIPPALMKTVFGSISISASGKKEALAWSIQQFYQMNFQYEPQAKAITQWNYFFSWAILQQPFEFTPDISLPTIYDPVTLESTSMDGKGLGYKMEEMLPDFPFFYRTGLLKLRVVPLT